METLEQDASAVSNAVSAFANHFLGGYWYLFLAYFLLNLLDYVTMALRSWTKEAEESEKERHGFRKKLGSWIVIFIAFLISTVCEDVGASAHLDLRFFELAGFMTLAAYIVGEIGSVLRNVSRIGTHVPPFLSKGIDAAQKMLDDAEEDKK